MSGDSGRPKIWMARGAEAQALLRVLVPLTDIVGVSSIYTSALQQQSTGSFIIVDKAMLYRMTPGRGELAGIRY